MGQTTAGQQGERGERGVWWPALLPAARVLWSLPEHKQQLWGGVFWAPPSTSPQVPQVQQAGASPVTPESPLLTSLPSSLFSDTVLVA